MELAGNLGSGPEDSRLEGLPDRKGRGCFDYFDVSAVDGSQRQRINLNARRLFTGRKETLDELVAAAAAQYWETSSRRVTVHMCESYGDWGAIITKQIRPMDSVILPGGMTDVMLDDLRDFLDNKVRRSLGLREIRDSDVLSFTRIGMLRLVSRGVGVSFCGDLLVLANVRLAGTPSSLLTSS